MHLPSSMLIADCSGFSVKVILGFQVRSFLVKLSKLFIMFSLKTLIQRQTRHTFRFYRISALKLQYVTTLFG